MIWSRLNPRHHSPPPRGVSSPIFAANRSRRGGCESSFAKRPLLNYARSPTERAYRVRRQRQRPERRGGVNDAAGIDAVSVGKRGCLAGALRRLSNDCGRSIFCRRDDHGRRSYSTICGWPHRCRLRWSRWQSAANSTCNFGAVCRHTPGADEPDFR